MSLRFGAGLDSNATLVTGDRLIFGSISLHRVPGLDSPLPTVFSNSPLGAVGYDATPTSRAAGSCVLAVGDSWSNDAPDWPGILSDRYGRETVVCATAGHSLAQMLAALAGYWGAQSRLYPPNYNAPGIMVLVGGVNDRLGNRSGQQMINDASAIIAEAEARRLKILLVTQVDCTDATTYTAARAQAFGQYVNWVKTSGYPYVDLAPLLQNADGTANQALMLSESLAWIHPNPDGHAVVARAIDAKIEQIDQCGAAGYGVWVA